MIIENKICILINWSREIDMFESLIRLLPNDKLDVIINDIGTLEKERKGNALQIKNNLIIKKIEFRYFSEIFKKKKYKIVISTGFAHSSKITVASILKYLYGKSIGHFFDLIGISKIFNKLFDRPFNAGGKHSRIGSYAWYPEKIIGEKSIRYPSGMDLKLRYYPPSSLEKNFDIFFTHSQMETDLIKKKFKKKICNIIGYPRYENLKKYDQIKNDLKKEFSLNNDKKLIFWTPTHIFFPQETSLNFLPWIETMSKLNNEFNIIIRPHPKLLNKEIKILDILRNKNFFVDLKSDRKIGEIYKVSDLIICDYGGTIFSALYLEKPILLLNIDKNTEFYNQQQKNLSLDIFLRNEIINLDLNQKDKLKLFFSKALEREYINKIKSLKKKYFGEKKDYLSKEDTVKLILNYLK